MFDPPESSMALALLETSVAAYNASCSYPSSSTMLLLASYISC